VRVSLILAIETATAACSAALCSLDGALVAQVLSLEGPAHAQRLLPGVHDVMQAAGADWDDIAGIAVSLGPGAFTGLRIGIATARALAQADGRLTLYGVPTTAALALALADDPAAAGRLVVPVIDGRRREVFAAVYAREDAPSTRLTVVGDIAVVSADAVTDWLAGLGPVVVGGDGAALYAGLLPSSALFLTDLRVPTAAMVGRAVACGAPGVVAGPDAVLPLYGRVPDAVRWAPPSGTPGPEVR
jgi:tRNA threonylcarbamoyladenosine biosynthesis protein TsaB